MVDNSPAKSGEIIPPSADDLTTLARLIKRGIRSV
jgi:hypothetical protein